MATDFLDDPSNTARRTPPPFRGLNGIVIHFAALKGIAYDDAGTEVTEAVPDLHRLIAGLPFRSVICRRWPTRVGAVWPLLREPVLPIPDAMMTSINEAFSGGFGVLILSADRDRRDTAKRLLGALLGDAYTLRQGGTT